MTTPPASSRAISDEGMALLRRLRIQHRTNPTVFEDLLILTAYAHTIAGTARDTELVIEHGHAESSHLTVQQAADLTGLQPVTIRRACREHRLDATKAGRDWAIPRTALARWLVRRSA